MKNRAKCKLCTDIIESMHRTDYQTCKCGQISLYGGPDIMECGAIDWANFIRVDDHGNEIIIKVIDKAHNVPLAETTESKKHLSNKEIREHIKHMITAIEQLPAHAMHEPITHYDYCSLLMILSAIVGD
jgi:hypothetical protein